MDTVGTERKRAKDHGSFAEKSHGGKLLEIALGYWECWENSSSCRWCRVETGLTVLRQEANPPAGSCALTKTCCSLHSPLKAFYLERTFARRGWVLSMTLTTKLGVGPSACVQGPMNHRILEVGPRRWQDGLLLPRACHHRGVGASSLQRRHNRMVGETLWG